MAKPSDDRRVRSRLERLDREIETMRAREAEADLRAADELADFSARHAALHSRLAELEAQGKPEHHIDGALAADLDGLAESVRRWIKRQDTKTAHR